MPAPAGRSVRIPIKDEARSRTKTRSEPELKHGAKQKWNEAQNQNCFSAKRWRRNANHGREEICLEYLIRPFSQRWQGDLAGIAEQLPQSWMLPPMQQSGVALQPPNEKAFA